MKTMKYSYKEENIFNNILKINKKRQKQRQKPRWDDCKDKNIKVTLDDFSVEEIVEYARGDKKRIYLVNGDKAVRFQPFHYEPHYEEFSIACNIDYLQNGIFRCLFNEWSVHVSSYNNERRTKGSYADAEWYIRKNMPDGFYIRKNYLIDDYFPSLATAYIADPAVFYKNDIELGKHYKKILQENGFDALCPLDVFDITTHDVLWDKDIVLGNMRLIDAAKIVIANCNPFRGFEIDSSIAFEIGYAIAKNKMVFCHTDDIIPMDKIMINENVTIVHGDFKDCVEKIKETITSRCDYNFRP